MSKAIVCRCEDVTADDVAHAVACGYRDLEEVKRFTGFGTGPCQGKECHAVVARQLAQLTGTAPATMAPFTARAPLVPTPFRALAGLGALESPYRAPASSPSLAAPATPREADVALAAQAPTLPTQADTVIIGAGVIGLAIAYYLTKAGVADVVVIDRSYLAAGASGRNGGGIRQQWSTELNVRLMQASVALCREFATELRVNNWFRQGGYLFLARTEAEVAKLTRNAELHARLGVGTRVISPSAAGELVPELDLHGIVAAAYNPSDGIVFPWPFLWGYAQAAQAGGARLFTHTAVHALERDQGSAGGGLIVRTARGSVRARRVVNAAGAWSPQLAAMLGVALPTWPVRHEICSSEPLKPFLRPMVSELASGLYCSQSMRGELVGGCTVPDEGTGLDMSSTSRFLATYAERLTSLMPGLARVKMLRQWAGPYERSPDGNPLLGPPTGVPNFYLAAGFVGHGFMMAPIVGKLYAAWLAGGDAAKHELFDHYAADRFERGGGAPREDFSIG